MSSIRKKVKEIALKCAMEYQIYPDKPFICQEDYDYLYKETKNIIDEDQKRMIKKWFETDLDREMSRIIREKFI
jgi:hypothetical protein